MGRRFVAIRFAVLSTVLLLGGCAPQEETARVAPAASASMPSLFPAAGLRLAGSGESVLAEGGHGIRVTLADYNAAAEDYHFPADLDTVDARRQLLEKVIDFEIIAAEGRLRGYSADEATNLREEKRALVAQVVQQNMVLASAIPESDALRFVDEHPERFAELDPAAIEDGSALMHVRFVMRDEQFRSEIAEWAAREGVVVHRERFERLLRDERSPGE